jgi:hypothetical protein
MSLLELSLLLLRTLIKIHYIVLNKITILYKVSVTLAEVSNLEPNFLRTNISMDRSATKLQTLTARHGFS